jgi:hypothetical protein
MFVIMPFKDSDWAHALFILSYYAVELIVRSNGEQASSTYMVVRQLDTDDTCDEDAIEKAASDYRCAEMCFQGNWHTHKENLCPDCIDYSEQLDTCGHLAFSEPINPAF